MPSEYDPLVPRADLSDAESDLELVQPRFEAATAAFLTSPWTWVGWAILLPSAALATTEVGRVAGARGVVTLWSLAILAGGVVEGLFYWLRARRARRTPLAGWLLRVQGNLSLVAILLTGVLLQLGRPLLLPGLWLLILGHSFYAHGGLAFRRLKIAGWIYQLGGLTALLPGIDSLRVFAATAALGNLWVAWAVWKRRRSPGPPG